MYLGRFQMFHKGHLDIAKYIHDQPDTQNLIFLIGSAQYSRYNKHPFLPGVLNPFTSEERTDMIQRAVTHDLKRRYEIINVPDLHVCDRWYDLVMHKARPDVLYTNEPKEIDLFGSHGTHTRRIPVGEGYHAQVIREMIAYGDHYDHLIPKGTKVFIEEKGIEKILRDFYEGNMHDMAEVHAMQRKKGIRMYGE